MSGKVLSMFTGAGGMDTGARALGLETFGAEIDPRLASIAQAAGHSVEVRDVRTIAPPDGRRVHGAMGGPPCQTFSPAGKGDGRVLLPVICELARTGSVDDLIRWSWSHSASYGLVLEPLRVLLMMGDNPLQWLALEQVPPVLPVWEAVADRLRAEGYSVATGVLKAEEYGVPQTRRRAALVAALGRPVKLPAPTHRAYRKGVPQAAGNPFLHPWVSMADALGCGDGVVRTQQRSRINRRGDHRMYERSLLAPSPTVTGTARTWVLRSNYGTGGNAAARGHRQISEPAPTITSKAGRNYWLDGEHVVRRLAVEEAAELQSFPSGYPWWVAPRSGDQFLGCGNAVPPVLWSAVLREVIG